VMTTWHWDHGSGHQYSAMFTQVDRTQWHVYTVEHTAQGFRFWVDGQEQQLPAEWNANNDLTTKWNFGIGAVAYPPGSGGAGWFGATDSSTPDPYYFYVEYVRMWKQP